MAVTLETAYDDWCMAEWAKALNKKEDYGPECLGGQQVYSICYDERQGAQQAVV